MPFIDTTKRSHLPGKRLQNIPVTDKKQKRGRKDTHQNHKEGRIAFILSNIARHNRKYHPRKRASTSEPTQQFPLTPPPNNLREHTNDSRMTNRISNGIHHKQNKQIPPHIVFLILSNANQRSRSARHNNNAKDNHLHITQITFNVAHIEQSHYANRTKNRNRITSRGAVHPKMLQRKIDPERLKTRDAPLGRHIQQHTPQNRRIVHGNAKPRQRIGQFIAIRRRLLFGSLIARSILKHRIQHHQRHHTHKRHEIRWSRVLIPHKQSFFYIEIGILILRVIILVRKRRTDKWRHGKATVLNRGQIGHITRPSSRRRHIRHIGPRHAQSSTANAQRRLSQNQKFGTAHIRALRIQ
mmetsp:Transcript_20004/g.29809  ORF Transcript_20004/g.29809 Transcript_20004/m.29809 type:complete len:354 (-) Transcript_20004:1219-2280(-)